MNKFNNISLLLLAFMFLLAALLSNNAIYDLYLVVMVIINVALWQVSQFLLGAINRQQVITRAKLIAYFLLLQIPALISIAIAGILFTNGNTIDNNNHIIPTTSSQLVSAIRNQQIALYKTIVVHFYHKLSWVAFNNACFLVVRIFSLSIASFAFVLIIDFKQIILNLMQIKILSVQIGYALFAMLNAMGFMHQEYKRINYANKMRFRRYKIFPLLPLMVSASRYAHYASLSMELRGLNSQKTYILPKEQWHIADGVLLFSNAVIITILAILR